MRYANGNDAADWDLVARLFAADGRMSRPTVLRGGAGTADAPADRQQVAAQRHPAVPGAGPADRP
ncbi:hypothetical protein [Nostocoides australiense]